MVPRVTSKGKSFKGAGQYFLHDLGKAQTSERVAFTHTVNMLTDDPEKALKVMAWTAAHAQELKQISGQKLTGRKAENPVYNYCLAWAPDQNPDQAHVIAFGLKSLDALGVSEHEALFIAHDDTDHKHLHIMVNRVHPVTGLMAKMDHDQNRLSRLAQSYEEETGRVYCPARVENNRQRARGEQHVVDRNRDQRQAQTPEYRARRAARIEAQQKAAALALEQIKARDAQAAKARDLRAAFDQSAGHDDRQYRAKEIERTATDEQRLAQAAWTEERAQERARTDSKGRALSTREAVREQRRQAWLGQKRATEWAAYEGDVLQRFSDRQTDRRESLYTRQADARARFEERLGAKYEPAAATLQHRIEAVTAELDRRGARGLLDRLTGAQADRKGQLESLDRAVRKLDEQRQQERKAFEDRQAKQRADLAKRQEAERLRLDAQLRATQARQDAAFAQRESERVERLRQAATERAGQTPTQRAAEQAREAQREAVRALRTEAARRRDGGSRRAVKDAMLDSPKYKALAAKAAKQSPSKPRTRGKDHGPER